MNSSKAVIPKATERTGGGPLSVDKVDTNTGIGRTYRWTHFSKHLVTPSLARKVVRPLFFVIKRGGSV